MKKIVRRTILASIIAIAVLFFFFHNDNNEYSRHNLEAYVQKMCELYDVPGLSAAIIDGDKEFYINYGEGIDENSGFELASTTKAFTALAVLKLEKEGKLRTSDAVTKYLPWFTPTYKGECCEITIEELICHTSGIPVWTITTIPVGEGTEEGLLEKTIRNIKDVELNSRPGTHHEYATINYDILALILEEAAGEKYEDYVTAEILSPLGMQDSFFRTTDTLGKKAAQGHKTGFFLPLKYNAPTYYGNTAAGYLVSTTGDLMKWLKIWCKNSVESQFSGNVSGALGHDVSKTDHYYAGWNIYADYICHGGNNPNFSSQVIISRDRNQGVFVLSNLAGSSATQVADGIYRILLGETIKPGFQPGSTIAIDFLSVEGVLLMIYLFILYMDKKSKAAKIIRISVSLAIIAAIIILPIVLHYPFSMIFVWMPITTSLAAATAVLLALLNLITIR